jgi:hypothetical protein
MFCEILVKFVGFFIFELCRFYLVFGAEKSRDLNKK